MDLLAAATVLGVSPDSSATEIRRAFRARAKATHPDRAGSSTAFVEVRQAFDLLISYTGCEPVVEPGDLADRLDLVSRFTHPTLSDRPSFCCWDLPVDQMAGRPGLANLSGARSVAEPTGGFGSNLKSFDQHLEAQLAAPLV